MGEPMILEGDDVLWGRELVAGQGDEGRDRSAVGGEGRGLPAGGLGFPLPAGEDVPQGHWGGRSGGACGLRAQELALHVVQETPRLAWAERGGDMSLDP